MPRTLTSLSYNAGTRAISVLENRQDQDGAPRQHRHLVTASSDLSKELDQVVAAAGLFFNSAELSAGQSDRIESIRSLADDSVAAEAEAIGEVKARLAKLTRDRDKAEQEVAELTQSIEGLGKQKKEAESSLSELKRQAEKAKQEKKEADNERAATVAQIAAEKGRRDEASASLQELKKQVSAAQKELREILSEVTSRQSELSTQEAQVQAMAARAREEKSRYDQARLTRNTAEAEKEAVVRALSEKQVELRTTEQLIFARQSVLPSAGDWPGFALSLSADSEIDALLDSLPKGLQLALGTAIGQSAEGKTGTFSRIWPAVLQSGAVSLELANKVQGAAVAAGLPASFVNILNPANG